MKENDLGLERGDCQTFSVAGALTGVEEGLLGGGGVGDETEIVDVEKMSRRVMR